MATMDRDFSLEDWLPQHWQTGPEQGEFGDSRMSTIMRGFHEELKDEIVPLFRNLPSIRSPFRFPLELRRPLAEYIGFEVPQIRKQSEEEIRRQFNDFVDWIKLKPSERAVRTYLNSIGFFASVDIMFALEDYTNYTPWFDLPHDWVFEGFHDSPHALVTLSPFQPIVEDTYITKELFGIIKVRLNRVYAIELVPHYDMQLNLVATETPENFQRYGVIGSTTDRWKRRPSPRLDHCHRGTYELRAGIEFDGSYANKIERWEAGYDEQLRDDAQNGVSLSDVSPPSPDILNGTDPETGYNEEQNRGEVYIEPEDTSSAEGELLNWLALYDHEDQMAGLWTFPETEIIDDLGLSFFVQVLDKFTRITGRVSEADPQQTFNGVETWLLNDYDFNYNEKTGLDRNLNFSQNWSLDEPLNTTYLAFLRNDGYAWIGNSEGSGLPALDANDYPETRLARCHNFNLGYNESLDELTLTLDLTLSPLFGEPFDMVVFYDRFDNPVVVSKFDQEYVVDDQYDETKYRLIHEL